VFEEVSLVFEPRIFFFPSAPTAGESSTHDSGLANATLNSAVPRRSFKKVSVYRNIHTALLLLITFAFLAAMTGCGFHLNGSSADGAQIRITPAHLSFGTVAVGQSVSTSVTVVNPGTSPLTISGVNIDDKSFSVSSADNPPVDLGPFETYTFKVDFKPKSPAPYKANLTIQSTAVNDIGAIPVSGSGTSDNIPQISLSSSSLAFGSVAVGNSVSQPLVLTNVGSIPLNITALTPTGASFTVTGGSFPLSLDPNASVSLQVLFSPMSGGDASGQIEVDSNSGSNPVALVTLSGSGAVTSIPQLSVNPIGIDFGSVAAGTTGTQTLTLISTGTEAVVVNSVAVSGGGFSLSGASFPATLIPGQQLALQVEFAPGSAGNAAGQIVVSSNSVASPTTTVNLSGTGTSATPPPSSGSPQLSVLPGSLSFGDVTIGSPTSQSVALVSTGTSAVTITSANLVGGAGFSIAGGGFPITLNPNQQISIPVEFDPAATGAVTGKIVVTSDSSAGPATIGLSGNGVASPTPQLAVSPGAVSFGSVTVGSPVTQDVTITSTGTAAVTITSVSISGKGFTVSGGTFPLTLNPNQQVTLQVEFDPTATGSAGGQLTVNSNSSAGPVALVSLSGTGAALPNPQLAVSPGSISFSSVTIGTPTTQSVTLTSTGTAPVTITSAVISGLGFSVSGGNFPMALTPNQQVTLQIQFDPQSAGAATGQLTVSSSSSGNPVSVVTLSGTGTAAPSPQLSVSPGAISFGPVTLGSPLTQNVTLTSTGTAPVTVNSIAIAGTGFTVSGASFPVTLNPNLAVTLQVEFNPTATGAATGQLTIKSNSSTGTTTVVNLSGTGAAVQHGIALTWNAPVSSPDPVVGYNIYRSIGGTAFELVNASVNSQVDYSDTAIQSGLTYTYVVTSVDVLGQESEPSNQASATVP
jgi:hypothetical protein